VAATFSDRLEGQTRIAPVSVGQGSFIFSPIPKIINKRKGRGMKSNRHVATKKHKQNPRPDLLGCICLDADCEDPDAEHGCTRNCRRENNDWDEPDGAELVFIPPQPPQMDEPSNIAYERALLEEDKRPTKEVVALAAWSNGQIEIWFE
jgi:hypothetical protein